MKPELLHDERIATRSDTARLLYYGLLGIVDDKGRAQGAPLYLHGQVFWGSPRPIRKVEAAVKELVKAGILRQYEVHGAIYVEIVDFLVKDSVTQQLISKPTPSSLPGPSSVSSGNATGGTAEDSGAARDVSVPVSVSEPLPVSVQGSLGGPIDSEAAGDRSSPGQDLKATIDAFHVRYVAAYEGRKPTWGGKPSAQLKRLIKQHGAEEVQRRIAVLFDSPPAWLEPPFTVGTLEANFDRLSVPGRKGPIGVARHPNAPNDFFGSLDEANADMKRKAGP